MKYLKIIIYIGLAICLLSGCKRQPIYKIESQSNKARIAVAVDWSASNLDLEQVNNVSLYGFNSQSGESYSRVGGDIYETYVELPAGEYSLLLFNDFVGDILSIKFTNSDNYNLFAAQTIEQNTNNTIYYTPQSDEIIVQEVGGLAAWQLEELEVNPIEPSCSYCKDDEQSDNIIEIDAAPSPITTRCIIDLAIENLNNASYIEASLKGFAAGAYLVTNERLKRTAPYSVYCTDLGELTFDDENDGVAHGEINTFGKVASNSGGDPTYEVVINIIIGNGELLTFSRDVTEQVTPQDNTIIYINLTSEQDKIALPSGQSAGFGVEDWGEKEQIELM